MNILCIGSQYTEKRFFNAIKEIIHKPYKDITDTEMILYDLFHANVVTTEVDELKRVHYTLIGGETITL